VIGSLSREAGEGQGGGGAIRLAALLHSPIPASLLLVLLAFTSVFATQAFLGPVAASTLCASPALLQAMIAVGAVIGVPAGAAIAERHPRHAAALIAAGLLAAALWQWGLLAGEKISPLLQAGQVVFASAALFAVSPVLQARLVAAAGEARRLVLAANFVAVSLGQAAGAGLGGMALAPAGLTGAAAVGVLAAACMLVLASRPTRVFAG
jgi:predicted MFS family arabinose efflux permease